MNSRGRSIKEIMHRRQRKTKSRLWPDVFIYLSICLISLAIFYEIRTSYLQSLILTNYAPNLSYSLGDGPSRKITFPQYGPFNKRRGYTKIPTFIHKLSDHGLKITKQVRFSNTLFNLSQLGVTPPYPEPFSTGLIIYDSQGKTIFNAASQNQYFNDFKEIPDIIIKSLLFIEDKELNRQKDPRKNPVINWKRFAKAALLFIGNKLGFSTHIEGGSTLATQLEKYKFSPHGNTISVWDKIRQMLSASIKVYQQGADTRPARKRIILDYLNTVPLSAVQKYGEVYGLAEGLKAWFDLDIEEAISNLSHENTDFKKAETYRKILTLLCAVRAPTQYLKENPSSLDRRVLDFLHLMEVENVIDEDFALSVSRAPVIFSSGLYPRRSSSKAMRKAVNAIRINLLNLLGVKQFYELDRLHLEVNSTLDQKFQNQIALLIEDLKDPLFVRSNHLFGKRLLSPNFISHVNYSFLLFEKSSKGNMLRVQIDNMDSALDMNSGTKLELGSTAKLRTLIHYLEIIEILYDGLGKMDKKQMRAYAHKYDDPITNWTIKKIRDSQSVNFGDLLKSSLERTYSANPKNKFFTGGGMHKFHNFNHRDNTKTFSIREATYKSVNLVYIRLMQEIIQFHKNRLPYDIEKIISKKNNPVRMQLLDIIIKEEIKSALSKYYHLYREMPLDSILKTVLQNDRYKTDRLALLYNAWQLGDLDSFHPWLAKQNIHISQKKAHLLFNRYQKKHWTIKDYAYLLNKHVMDLACAGIIFKNPKISWQTLFSKSESAREIARSWMRKSYNSKMHNRMLKIYFEKLAFKRMTPYWQALGYPFRYLVPSLATALGSSGDRPSSLAQLMGILVNNGIKLPTQSVSDVTFARHTPYETHFQKVKIAGQQVLHPSIAKEVKKCLYGVVDFGTAIRARNSIQREDESFVKIGGKTGSGDNRFKTFDRYGNVISSRVVNRTATFVFIIGDRYFGVVNAYVQGEKAQNYHFTSSLPVAIFKLAAPIINQKYTVPVFIN